MTDTNARAALAARQERIELLGPVAFVPLLKLADIRFRKHRTCAEVMAEAREEQVRRDIRRGLGR